MESLSEPTDYTQRFWARLDAIGVSVVQAARGLDHEDRQLLRKETATYLAACSSDELEAHSRAVIDLYAHTANLSSDITVREVDVFAAAALDSLEMREESTCFSVSRSILQARKIVVAQHTNTPAPIGLPSDFRPNFE